MNNCDTCVWATRNGGCASWGCDYIPMKEAAEAWKALRGKTYPCDPAKNTTCTKTGCYYVNGGDCYQTTNPDYKREADPVKHGKWVMQGTAYGCSLCGEGVIHPFHNYCPNCGARMDEVTE